jgi:hypothetical protein
VSFKSAVLSIPELKNSFCQGLQALRSVDKQHVSAADPRKLEGSVDLDSSTVDFGGKRWDYAIGYERPSNKYCIFWIEVHPANSGEVAAVIGKLQTLKSWLSRAGTALDTRPRRFIWVSSGKTSFTLSAPQKKQFAELGLESCGRHLQIS